MSLGWTIWLASKDAALTSTFWVFLDNLLYDAYMIVHNFRLKKCLRALSFRFNEFVERVTHKV